MAKVLIAVSGGEAFYAREPGVDVELVDLDQLRLFGKRSVLPIAWADLAKQLGITDQVEFRIPARAVEPPTVPPADTQKKGPEAPYGRCPICGAIGVAREKRINGNDRCANGCVYPSLEAVKVPVFSAASEAQP